MSNLISVLLAVYNGENYIGESIQSVIDQDYSNWELIIVDNGSLDSTTKIVEGYCENDSRIKLFKLEERGKCNAYNFGFINSIGDYICFFAADDIYARNNLSLRLDAILGKGNELYSTCLLKTFSENSKYDGLVFPKNVKTPNFSGGSIFFGRHLAQYIFPIPDFLPNEDTWASLCLRFFGSNIHISEALYLYRIHLNNSNGYDLDYSVKKEKYLTRMKAYELFYNRFNALMDTNGVNYINEFIRGLNYCENNNKLKILFKLKLPLKEKLIFFYYSSKVLYDFRQFFFKLTSGILN